MAAVSMTVNGKPVTADIDPRTLLVQFVRENLRLAAQFVDALVEYRRERNDYFFEESRIAEYRSARARSGGDVYWRLLDPYGRAVFGPSYMNGTSGYDIDPTTLGYSGTYTLLVEGRYYTSGTASYATLVAKYWFESIARMSVEQKVGQTAAEIREYRGPEPYKGKGVKYAGEFIFRKEGKKK